MIERESEEGARTDGPLRVVAIGASADRPDPLERLIAAAPAGGRVAYVVVQRGAGEGTLERLAGATSMDVRVARDGEPLEAARVYLAPPDAAVELREGRLCVLPPDDPVALGASLDVFLRSAAEELGPRALGIVLAGGVDGRVGLRAIRAHGGLAVAHDPGEEGGNGARRADLGEADFVRTVEGMAELVERFARRDPAEIAAPAGDPEEDAARLEEIVRLVRKRSGFDVGLYKLSTVERRVRRRMGLAGIRTLADYVGLLRAEPREIALLQKDVLISVTDFFRDPEAFDWLQRHVVSELVRDKRPGEPVRVWVPGCATGEEAYSLAILFVECAAELDRDLDLQIFATDLDEDALRTARAGRYAPSALARVSPERREAFFRVVDGAFQVEKHLRELVSFSRHHVVEDPPFTRLDLLSCRNLLIYLRRDVQQHVTTAFHFGLRPNGCLFLGGSEVPVVGASLFRPLSKSHRVYQRVGVARAPAVRFQPPAAPAPAPRAPAADPAHAAASDPSAEIGLRALLGAYVPSAVVTDASGRILYLHGAVQRYLEWPRGEMHQDLLRLLPGDLRTRVRGGIYRALSEERPHVVHCRRESGEHVRITISPESPHGETVLAIAFETVEASAVPLSLAPCAPGEETLARRLEDELQAARQDLATTVEELEAANEELRSSNEESTSMNEELQSTNEELEASAEELRSLNEELATVNVQLKEKVEELEAANNDSANFFASTRLATLFFDEDLHLRRFTPEAARLLRLAAADVGRPLEEVTRAAHDEVLASDARRVIDELTPHEAEVRQGDAIYVRRMLPYRTEDNRIGGVVVTYSDVTPLSRAMEDLRRLERQQGAIATLGLDALRSGDQPREDFFQKTAQIVASVLDLPMCKVLQLVPERGDLLLVAGVGWKEGLVGRTYVGAGTSSQAGYALGAAGPVVVRDVGTEQRFSGPPFLVEHGVKSGMSCVIETPNGKWGVIGAHTTRLREFREEEVAFLQQAANLLGYFVHSRQIRAELEAGERTLRLALDGAGMGAWAWNVVTGEVTADERLYDLLGLPRGGVARLDDLLATVHAEDRERVAAALRRAGQSGGEIQTEFRVALPDKSRRWIAVRGRRHDDARHGPVLHAVDFDVTRRKLAEVEAERSRERLRRTVALSEVGIAFCRASGEILEANDALLALLGIDRETYVSSGLLWSDLSIDGDPALARPAAETPSAGRAVEPVQVRIKGAGGEPLDVLYSAASLGGDDHEIVAFFVDVREMKRTERMLRTSEERMARSREELAVTQQRLEQAMEAGNIGTWRVDLVEGVIERDERTNRILGGDPVATVMPQAELFRSFHEEDRVRAERAWSEALEGGGVFEVEGRIRRPDGAIRWVRTRGRALHGPNGRVIAASGAMVDVTDHKQAEARLQDLARRKDEFIAVLGHELRNPLSAISSCAWLLRQGDASEEETTSLYRMIGQQVDQMTHLLNDLLDLARVTRGQIRLELAPLKVAEVVEAARRAVSQHIEDREHRLTVTIDPPDLVLRADAKRLEQIVVNLLTNAARYTDVGGRIDLVARAAGDDVTISVQDNGIGLAPSELDAIFEPFSQVHRGSGGLGIGLTLVRQLVERHGGRVGVRSEGPGKGSVFEVVLPASRVADAPREAVPDEVLRPIRGRILIVDDNDSTVYALSALLTRAGARVSTASTGAAALAAVERARPDVVLLDIGLPDGSGFEVAQALRERCGDQVPYLIAITGFGDPSTRRHLHESFDEHVIKPIDHHRVFTLIASATASRGTTA